MFNDNDFDGKKFPYPESNNFEYKQSIDNSLFDKYLEIICGFLNSKGGNLIFGIRNNLDLVGINILNSSLDTFIVRIDSIIRDKKIIGINNYTNNLVAINSSNITTRQFVNKFKKRFLIIEIKPNSDIKYQLADGMIYYRLGASNYCEKTEKIYKQHEYENACRIIQNKANDDNRMNNELFRKTLKDKDKDIKLLKDNIKDILKTNSIFEEYLIKLIRYTNVSDNTIKQPTYLGENINDFEDGEKQNLLELNESNHNQDNPNPLYSVVKSFLSCFIF